MSAELNRLRNLRKLLETMAYDIVNMSIYWKMNNIESDHELGYPSLKEQLDFTTATLFKCDMDEKGLRPVLGVGAVEKATWTYALLYDVCEAKGLVKREHPEDDFKIADAFDNGRFIGWEVCFFETLSQVREYIKRNSQYSNFSIYKGFTKLKSCCWEYCEAYQHFLNGNRVKTEELCFSCILKDFHKVMEQLSDAEEVEVQDFKVADAPTCCEFCDFKDLSRFHEPCHSCNDAMRRNLIRQGQLKIIE